MGNTVSNQADFAVDGYEQEYVTSSDAGGYGGLGGIGETTQNEEEEEEEEMEHGGEDTDGVYTSGAEQGVLMSSQKIQVHPLRSSSGSMGQLASGSFASQMASGSLGPHQMAASSGDMQPHPPQTAATQVSGPIPLQTMTHLLEGRVMQYPPLIPTQAPTQVITALPPTGLPPSGQQQQQHLPAAPPRAEPQKLIPKETPLNGVVANKDESRQYIEGLTYSVHQPGAGPTGFIDATQGNAPWALHGVWYGLSAAWCVVRP